MWCRKLTSLPAAFTATGLTATFTSITAAGLFAAALLSSSAASVWLPARATTAAVACLCLLLFCDHKPCLSLSGNCGAVSEMPLSAIDGSTYFERVAYCRTFGFRDVSEEYSYNYIS